MTINVNDFRFSPPAVVGGGGGGGYSLITNSKGESTTTAVDSTGSTLIVVAAHWLLGASSISDSKGNTWTPLTQRGQDSYFTRLYYCINPIVGSGHTVSLTATVPAMTVTFWSKVSPVFDQESGVNLALTGTTVKPGVLTPSQDNCLLVTSVTYSELTANASVDSGFTKSDQIGVAGGNGFGAMGYFIQTAAASKDPLWTISAGTNDLASAMVVFK